MSSDFSKEEAVKKYLPLMHELAIRIDFVAQAFDGKLNLPLPYAREYAYLQFRRMCELIALGCLLLHGDLPQAQSKSTKKEWNAERIMNLLYRNHPHSFPQSVIRTKQLDGWHIQANSKPNALTLDEFKRLYAECGHVLHRGTIQTVESTRDFAERDYAKAIEWQRKIVDLMNEHLISRANENSFYLISLRTESGYPECSTFAVANPGELHVKTQKMNVSDNIIHSYVANKLP
jgi:hypothetical protein